MNDSTIVSAFYVLFPTLFAAILEYYMFFHVTLSDVHKHKQYHYSLMRRDLYKKLNEINDINQRDKAFQYVYDVHQNAELLKDDIETRKQKEFRSKQRIAFVIISLLALFLIVTGFLFKNQINWMSLGIQTVMNTALLIAFQLYFYYEIAKKHNY